jgi:hypothetical protein
VSKENSGHRLSHGQDPFVRRKITNRLARFRWTPAPSTVGLLFQTLLFLRADFIFSSNKGNADIVPVTFKGANRVNAVFLLGKFRIFKG